MKWKGFKDKHNTWEKRKEIDAEIANELEASNEGNHLDNSSVREPRVNLSTGWKGSMKWR